MRFTRQQLHCLTQNCTAAELKSRRRDQDFGSQHRQIKAFSISFFLVLFFCGSAFLRLCRSALSGAVNDLTNA
jgi:hypothetical protein